MKHSSSFALPLGLLHQMVVSSREILPEPYARYRPLVADGICFFLERLPAARLRLIFVEQGRMPTSATIPDRLFVLLRQLPTLHKLGQVVARDHRLSPSFRTRLQQLESMRPCTEPEMVMRLLYREFPGWRKAGVNLGSQPLAEGSVAILMPFVWQKAGGGEPTQGVFKFLKPAIEDILAEELAIWDRLGRFLDDNCARYHLPEIHYQDTFQTVRDLLVHEVHLEEEQKHLLEAAEEYAGMDSVVVPGLLPFNSRRMTAMVRLRGVTLGESIDTQPAMGHATQWQTLRPSPIGWERENLRQSWHESNHFINKNELPAPALASVIAEALVARPLFSAHSAALFHGDPHAGNLFLTTDGQLGLLDWSLGGRLQKSERIELIQFLIGALSFDESRMQSAIGKLSRDTGDSKAVAEVLKGGLREMRWGRPLGLRWLTDLLDNLVARGRVRFNPDLLLFRKSLLTLEGVLADVVGGEQAAGEAALNQAFLAVLIGQLLREWPLRIKGPLDSRQFKTHLSTADLMSLFFSGPATMTHYWSCAWLDWLGLAT